MRKLDLCHFRFTSLLLAAVLLNPLSAGSGVAGTLELGDTAPDWILSDATGANVSFYQDSGDQPAVLLFWSSWCPHCEELMPRLEELQNELSTTGVKFYALNIWENGDSVAHLEESKLSFRLLLDADLVATRYKVRATPGVFVVDGGKSIRYIRRNGSSADEVYESIRTALSLP